MKILTMFAGLLVSGFAAASPAKFHISVSSVAHLKGQSVETGTPVVWTNSSGNDVSLVFDPGAGVTGATVQIPAGATAFTKDLAANTSAEFAFATEGLYRFALIFADGSVKSGELAVTAPLVVTVDVIGVAFAPKVLTIKAGQTVKWVNTTTMAHTVTTDPALAANAANAAVPAGAEVWHSGSIAPGASFARTLTVPGTYKYFCKPHEAMGHVGTVIVEP